MLRLVCLDIDDTLVDFTAASRRTLAALIGRADMWSLWEHITDQHVARVVAGELDYPGMHLRRTRSFLAELGVLAGSFEVAGFESRRREVLQNTWRLYDDVLPCLEWLLAAGLRIAAVTNASGAHQRAKLADLGLAGFFEHVVIAGEVGAAKPDPVMFDTVCRAEGCAPAEAVHVGDKLDVDAIGAREAGLTGVWLNRGLAAKQASCPEGVYTLSGLAELPELLVSEFVRIGAPVGT